VWPPVAGHFRLVLSSGRIEKTVEAHRGAVTDLAWNNDGSALLTVGEDGHVKVWSKSGMLRTPLAATGVPVYNAAWSPQSDHVLYTAGDQLVIKPLQSNKAKTEQWKAHDGVILVVDWCAVNNRIVSGGEDRKYKVWDAYGRIIYSSSQHDHPITAVRWCADGAYFAAAAYDMLRLCDEGGWSHSLQRHSSGSVYAVSWTDDGSQLALGCANGDVLFGHVVGQKLEWADYEVVIETADTVRVQNVSTGATEQLADFRDHVVKVAMGYKHLVVVTATQALVYSTTNWHTPVIVDLKEGLVSFIKQTPNHFALVDKTHGIQVYSYEGRLINVPKVGNLRPELFTAASVALSDDTLAVIDQKDAKRVHILDVTSGQPIGKPMVHTSEVVEVTLDQAGGALARHLAFVDKNRDLHLASARRSTQRVGKLGAMVESISWHDTWSVLAALSNNKLTVWYYPATIFVDPEILPKTRSDRAAADFGLHPQLESFVGNRCLVRRMDGALMPTAVSPYPSVLHGFANKRQWEDAIRICRFVKDPSLWACLAAVAASAHELNAAEVSYAAIEEIDKVQYLAYIKTIPTAEGREAEMALFGRQKNEAEAILLKAGLIYRAISMNCQLFRWERALEIAIKHKTHVDTVLGLRQQSLNRLGAGARETSRLFLKYSSQIEVVWENIQAKIAAEAEAERSRPGAVPYS
jgi:intraflagellar transport protein 80